MQDMMTPRAHTVSTRAPKRWPLTLIAAPAAVSIWGGWVGLGSLCGFGVVHPLPGIADGFQINTAITLPVGVEAYGAYALGAWLTPGTPDQAKKFARRSAIGALCLGMLGQVVYHLLSAAHAIKAPWPVVVLVSCMPVVTLGFGAALTHLLRNGSHEMASAMARPVASAVASQEATQDATSGVAPQAIGEAASQAISEPPAGPEAMPSGKPPSEPQATPVARQRKEPSGLSREPDAIKARAAYRRSVQAGKPLSDRKVGEMFGRGRTWGAGRITECEEGLQLAASGTK